MNIDRITAGMAVAGLVSWRAYEAYTSRAPSLIELRETRSIPAGDRALLDADFLVGGMVGIAGGIGWAVSGSPLPLVLLALTFAFVSLYYHWYVLRGLTFEEVERRAGWIPKGEQND